MSMITFKQFRGLSTKTIAIVVAGIAVLLASCSASGSGEPSHTATTFATQSPTPETQRATPVSSDDTATPLVRRPEPTRSPAPTATEPAPDEAADLLTLRADLLNTSPNGTSEFALSFGNLERLPVDVFAPAPDLPPCGANSNSSRAWIEIVEANSGQVLQLVCDARDLNDLQSVRLEIETSEPLSLSIRVVVNDRQTGKLYVSETVLVSVQGPGPVDQKPTVPPGTRQPASDIYAVDTISDEPDVNTGDGICQTRTGFCSLRAAIMESNSRPGGNVIRFAIPGEGPHSIKPNEVLPTLESQLVVDGYSQPGAHPNSLQIGSDAIVMIGLSGAVQSNGNGLNITGGNSVVRGLAITDYSIGIVIGSDANVIEGNFIGTELSGSTSSSNRTGVFVQQGATGNTIGGSTPEARNLISGNSNEGLAVLGTGTRVSGNLIGTDVTGTAAIANDQVGISIRGATNTLVGGLLPTESNVISGNEKAGVSIQSNAEGTQVQGNIFGADATAEQPIHGGQHIFVRQTGNILIGGVESGAANRFVFGRNALQSAIDVDESIGVEIRRNTYRGFVSPPIVIGGGRNDPGDVDTGANRQQNYPRIHSAIANGSGGIHFSYDVNSLRDSSTYPLTIEFYESEGPIDRCSEIFRRRGRGSRFLGDDVYSAEDAFGLRELTLNDLETLEPGQLVAATATDADGNTSEFSNCVEVSEAASSPVGSIDLGVELTSSVELVEDQSQIVTYTISVRNESTTLATGVVATILLPDNARPSFNDPVCAGFLIISCTASEIQPGQTFTRSFNVSVLPSSAGHMTVVALVEGNEADVDGTDNADESTIQVSVAGFLFQVNSQSDRSDSDPGNGVCADSQGQCTLRAAVMEANALDGADEIVVPEGNYLLSGQARRPEDEGRRGDLDITDDVTIRGAGPGLATIRTSKVDRIFHVHLGVDATIEGFTLTDSAVTLSERGSVIFNDGGKLVLSNIQVTGVKPDNPGVGVIASENGELEIADSQIVDNWGGIWARKSRVSVTRSVVDEIAGFGLSVFEGDLSVDESSFTNITSGFSMLGAAINISLGNAVIHNTLISGNSAGRGAAAIKASDAEVEIVNTTISDNVARGEPESAGRWAAVVFDASNALILNSTLYRNEASPRDSTIRVITRVDDILVEIGSSIIWSDPETNACNVSFPSRIVSLGNNIASDESCRLDEDSDQLVSDPLLAELAENGGSTLTHMLLNGSPAIDTGSCSFIDRTPLELDQRGFKRPAGLVCDVGAVESDSDA